MGRQKQTSVGRVAGLGMGELALLRYVAAHHPVTVREAAEAMGEARGVVRTTVLNEMSRLVAKGHLVRKRVGGVWQYWPRVQERKLLGEVVRAFVAGALGGSVSPFVAYLSEEGDVTAEELAELKAMVRELEARGKGKR